VDSPGHASPGLPEAARRIRIGMPHLDAGGLSENWLFRAAGDLHWEAITRRLGVASHEIETADRKRLYPMVIALRARYGAPLAAVRENDVLTWSHVDVVPCGGACARGLLVARVGELRFSVELLTSFAQRKEDGSLGTALPAARLGARWEVAVPERGFRLGGAREPAVDLAELARAARRGQPMADGFCGPALATGRPPLDQVAYQPSPYADYNGVGLLYFASYVTIAAGAERHMMHRRGWASRAGAATDWALATSPVRRDLFFHANLPLGESIRTELLAVEEELDADAALEDRIVGAGGPTIKTRLRLHRAGAEQPDGAPGGASLMADVVSRHAVLPVGGQRP
jgi:probable biosynthetic protein (TIGR04098 family)